MNEFFTATTEAVLAHRGMLDKYIGDSLMAVFRAPLTDADHALNACRAALDMRAALASLHARWRAEGRPCLEMRIGINTGPMVIGNIGTERRFNYTVMGDEVNVAARLEGANKVLGTHILVSASTRSSAGPRVVARPQGEVEVKGRMRPVAAFKLLAISGGGRGGTTGKRALGDRPRLTEGNFGPATLTISARACPIVRYDRNIYCLTDDDILCRNGNE